jgi:hypothetical protein
MPKRNNRRSKNKMNVDRVGLISNKFIDVTTDKLFTTISVYKTQYKYQVDQLLPSILSTKTRLVRFRRFHLEFSSTEAGPGFTGESVGVQANAVDVVTGNLIPVTKMMILSETNPRSMSFTLPSEFSRWYLTNSTVYQLFIDVFNLQLSANQSLFSVKIQATVDLQIPEPTQI